jgi:outer membrane lipoprotein SlyB
MMRKAKVFIVFILAMVFSGCAYQSGWTPVVDPYGDPNVANIQRDQVQCKTLAQRASGNPIQEVGKGALVGGVTGAAAGAAIGAAAGVPAAGAAIGAAAGGIGGMVKQGFGADNQYKQAFINCMRNRGHNVI